jgi:hypothetical protein
MRSCGLKTSCSHNVFVLTCNVKYADRDPYVHLRSLLANPHEESRPTNVHIRQIATLIIEIVRSSTSLPSHRYQMRRVNKDRSRLAISISNHQKLEHHDSGARKVSLLSAARVVTEQTDTNRRTCLFDR